MLSLRCQGRIALRKGQRRPQAIAAFLLAASFVLLALRPVAGMEHLDTTDEDFTDDGAAARFDKVVVSDGAVSLDLVEAAWMQDDWSAGPGKSVWNNDDGYHAGYGIEYNKTGEVSLWARHGDWTRMADMPLDLQGSRAVWTGDRFIIVGGLGRTGTSSQTWEYFPETDAWNRLADMPGPRFGHAAAWNGTGLFVLGDATDRDSFLSYNRTLDAWTALPDAPINRSTHTMVHSGDNRLFVLGGKNETGGVMDDLWVYNISSSTWVELTPAPKPLYGQASVMVDDMGVMLVTGGRGEGTTGYLWDTLVYDPDSDIWGEKAHMPSSRLDHSMVWMPDKGTSIVFGGEGDGWLGDLFIYSYENDSWSEGAKGPSPRGGHGSAYGNGLMGVFGGRDDSDYLEETWLFSFIPNRTVGAFASSHVDLQRSIDFVDLVWDADVPQGTTLELQVATNNDHQTWYYVGPDGTSDTWFNSSGQELSAIHDGCRYFRYKVHMTTDDVNVTPILRSVTLGYSYYDGPGTFVSRVFDLYDDEPEVTTFEWDSTEPEETSIRISVTSSPDADMSSPVVIDLPVDNHAAIVEDLGRYMTYKARLVSQNATRTPVLSEVRIVFKADASLSAPELDPLSGIEGTLFLYCVTYTDLAGRAPSLAQVVIDGTAYDMSTNDLDPTDGSRYTFASALGPGSHEYYFSFVAGDSNLRSPATGAFIGPKVEPKNYPPVPIISLPREGAVYKVGQNIVLVGDKSYDPDGSITRHEWASDLSGRISDIADNNITLLTGVHRITLTVVDDEGASSTAVVNITVLEAATNILPVPVILEGDFVKKVGETIVVDASHSIDPDGAIIRWTFDWNDGSTPTVQATGTASHIYATANTYKIRVTVTDNNNAINFTEVQVIINPAGSGPRPPPEEHGTTTDQAIFILVPVLAILLALGFALEFARRSKIKETERRRGRKGDEGTVEEEEGEGEEAEVDEEEVDDEEEMEEDEEEVVVERTRERRGGRGKVKGRRNR